MQYFGCFKHSRTEDGIVKKIQPHLYILCTLAGEDESYSRVLARANAGRE